MAGCQAILMLDMLGFSCCHIECQDLIQMQLKIQTKVNSNETDHGNKIFEQCFWEISGHFC